MTIHPSTSIRTALAALLAGAALAGCGGPAGTEDTSSAASPMKTRPGRRSRVGIARLWTESVA